MIDEFSSKKNFTELIVFISIIFHGSNVTAIRDQEPGSSSSLSPSRTDMRIRILEPVNGGNDAVVEAPVEVVGPRAVESAMLEKVETKRESRRIDKSPVDKREVEVRSSTSATDIPCFGVIESHGKDVPVEDDESNDYWEEEANDTYNNGDDDDDDEDIDDEEEEPEENEEPEKDYETDENDENDSILIGKAERRYRQGPKIWDQWGKWSTCSVSCGAGKLTRWRHCVAGGCSLGEKEAQLKTWKGGNWNPKVWDQWGRWSCCSATCGIGKYTRWRHCVAGGCVSGEKEAQIKSCKTNRCF